MLLYMYSAIGGVIAQICLVSRLCFKALPTFIKEAFAYLFHLLVIFSDRQTALDQEYRVKWGFLTLRVLAPKLSAKNASNVSCRQVQPPSHSQGDVILPCACSQDLPKCAAISHRWNSNNRVLGLVTSL